MKVFHDIGNFEIHVAFIEIYLVVNINLEKFGPRPGPTGRRT